ncbi:MAG: acetyl-CoA carboxylase biotin carboxyl carrier protein subunit [Advenella sp.]|jgi:acetyl-CoA carboxylase biotin carboxyl carrier protein|uniref:Acetyl-CoA carboxylase biotin carboxyl carrier protein subunit n=1 Tax=Advenella kashmirensis TaxID=310575 RepID=A0A356LCK5_9BURK|nr:acetyl-CoA carboxylase biotin carboxyl carrier protein subunit [Advenella sp. FME57]HBP28654.1 acetyl-CoA carboxylase biotin carboxyl carrier protein subunit [Advenella kashmirensis]
MSTELISEVTGTVWKILVQVGAEVTPDEPVLIVESMKMEIPVMSEEAGVLLALDVKEGDAVEDGQVVGQVGKRSG